MVAEAVQAQVAVVTATLKGIHFLDSTVLRVVTAVEETQPLVQVLVTPERTGPFTELVAVAVHVVLVPLQPLRQVDLAVSDVQTPSPDPLCITAAAVVARRMHVPVVVQQHRSDLVRMVVAMGHRVAQALSLQLARTM
jgi:hypothetical protein